MGLTSGVAAALKFKHFLVDQVWGDALPLVRGTWPMIALVAVELAVATFLLTRWWRVGCWSVIGILVLGNAAFAHAILNTKLPSCGCFGGSSISPTNHAILSLCVFVLAAYLLDRNGERRQSHDSAGRAPNDSARTQL